MKPLVLLAGVALAGLAVASETHAATARVEVYDRTTGATLSVHRRFGERWIAGERGHEYGLRIRNDSDVRVLAVVSVDGVNAVSGETASPAQPGYVIEPGAVATIEGWRKSLDRTAAFVFTDPSRAYATRTGRPDDVGVIGVALFRERAPAPPPEAELARAKTQDATTTAAARQPARAAAPSLGTGHGRSEHSPARWTAFERASATPDEIVALRYESRIALIAMGVLPREPAPRSARPEPFPAAFGFVPDP